MSHPAPCPARYGWPALDPKRPVLMGVLNVTPNSFSDGGRFIGAEDAIARALTIEAEGAAILDLGGESTHPKAAPVTAEEEQARVLPVLEAIRDRIGIPVSIDTYRAATADAALNRGARIVNDIWGLQKDPGMADVVAAHQAGVCIMHNRASVDPALDLLADICRFFEQSLRLADRAGIAREGIVLDPGIGFGKTFAQNVIAISRLGELARFGLPLLVGASRKGFIGRITGEEIADRRLPGSIAAHMAAVTNGASIIRAHDISEHRQALAVLSAVMRETID